VKAESGTGGDCERLALPFSTPSITSHAGWRMTKPGTNT